MMSENGGIKIEKGEIVVDSDSITILDNGKNQNNWMLVSSISWTVFGVLSVFRYLKGEDTFLLWMGMFFGLAHFGIVLYYLFFNSNASVIRKDQIVSIKKKNRLGNEVIAIKLNNGRIRKITQLRGNTDEIVAILNEKTTSI